jgi:hypothetical protein
MNLFLQDLKTSNALYFWLMETTVGNFRQESRRGIQAAVGREYKATANQPCCKALQGRKQLDVADGIVSDHCRHRGIGKVGLSNVLNPDFDIA